MAIPRPLVRLAARVKPKIPVAVWPTLLTTRSLLGGDVVIAPPQANRVLVLAPHPDDEVIGAGGTIALLARTGADVEVVAVTDGEATIGAVSSAEETAMRRRAELHRSVAVLGAVASSLGLPDGKLSHHESTVAEAVGSAIDRIDPDLILAPWLGDGHPDHQAVAIALAEALRRRAGRSGQVWGYETWAGVPQNRLVVIDEVFDAKQRALAQHVTADAAFDLTAGLGLSRWRAMHANMGRGHAEAFLAMSIDDYVALAERFDALAATDAASS